MANLEDVRSRTSRTALWLSALLIAGCVAPRAQETGAAAVAVPAPPPAHAQEEPLPRHWLGAFTMVQVGSTTAGARQFRLVLGAAGPNHFVATRGCYSIEGRLLRRGDLWLVEAPEGVRADRQCLEATGGHPGSPDRLFEHRAIRLSAPGGERWIEEGGVRWLYLQNPAAPPPPAREPPMPT